MIGQKHFTIEWKISFLGIVLMLCIYIMSVLTGLINLIKNICEFFMLSVIHLVVLIIPLLINFNGKFAYPGIRHMRKLTVLI